MGRWLCIDPGHKRTGIAVGSDGDGITSPIKTLPSKPPGDCIQSICDLAGEYDVQGIVVGWPINMDGTEGDQAKESRVLAAELAQASGLDVRIFDERLSSFAADKFLAGQLTRKKRRARQDAIAAATILGEFFATDGPANAPGPETDYQPPLI